ncbi:MAG: polysaccharide deacetylase family protein [Acidimicrobiia bacterium]
MARKGAKLLFTLADLPRSPRPGPRILIYHQIEAGLGRQMEVGLRAFRRQLDWIERHGRIVPLEAALAQRARPEADALFVLTFDDGYEDMFRLAFPILRERAFPFTLYLTTGSMESGGAGDAPEGARPLSWDQVGEMLASGLVTIGAHTHGHPDLRALAEEAIAQELDRSDELIERHIGLRPRHFAYPKGYWTAPAEPLVRERYASAVLGAGPPVTGETDPYRVHRIPVQRSDGVFFFTRKARTGLPLEERVRRVLRGYRPPDVARPVAEPGGSEQAGARRERGAGGG